MTRMQANEAWWALKMAVDSLIERRVTKPVDIIKLAMEYGLNRTCEAHLRQIVTQIERYGMGGIGRLIQE